MAVAYLATFILGAASGAIHPAFYAYIGAVLPLLTAFIYLYTCTFIRSFGAATALNGFVLVLFLIAGEADVAFIIGIAALTALSEIIRKSNGYETMKGVRWSFLPFALSFFTYTADETGHRQCSRVDCRLSIDNPHLSIGNVDCDKCAEEAGCGIKMRQP